MQNLVKVSSAPKAVDQSSAVLPSSIEQLPSCTYEPARFKVGTPTSLDTIADNAKPNFVSAQEPHQHQGHPDTAQAHKIALALSSGIHWERTLCKYSRAIFA